MYSKSEPGLEAPLLHAPGVECGWTHLTTTMMPTSHFAPSHHIMANERCGRMVYFCSSYAYSSSVKRSRKIGTDGRAEASAGETPTPPPSTSTLSAHVVACLSVRLSLPIRTKTLELEKLPSAVYSLWFMVYGALWLRRRRSKMMMMEWSGVDPSASAPLRQLGARSSRFSSMEMKKIPHNW